MEDVPGRQQTLSVPCFLAPAHSMAGRLLPGVGALLGSSEGDTLPEELASMRGLVTAMVSTAEGRGPACVCPAGDGRAGSIWPRTFPRGSWPVPPALQAEPVSFLPRRTDRPSRSQICFLRKRGLKAVL